MKNSYRRALRPLFPIAVLSLAAGFVNGLFGTGGGILILFFLSHFYDKSTLYDAKDLFAMTVGSVFLLSLSSVLLYGSSGALSLTDAAPFLVPAALGGLFGALLLDRVDTGFFKKLFSALVVYAGIMLIWK